MNDEMKDFNGNVGRNPRSIPFKRPRIKTPAEKVFQWWKENWKDGANRKNS